MDMAVILDKKQALEQAGGNVELARELFDMLLQELPGLRSKLQQAITERDNQAMWEHAHKLYGSTAYCGVPALRQSACDMEECIKQKDEQRLDGCYTHLANEIDRLLEQGPRLAQEPWETSGD
ncbi:MAG: Hpt domain-containing protein [Thiohalophilus sp.]|jgi:two-component system sensor histidine kinase BarA